MAVTDGDWIDKLRIRSEIEAQPEANFWKPGGSQTFGAIAPGELFLFKSHKSDGNQIVGGGIFEAFLFNSIEEAWDNYGLDNGVASFEEFVSRLSKLRRSSDETLATSRIGSTLLRDIRFFEPFELLDAPSDFSLNTVSGKSYDLDLLPADHPVVIAAAQLVAPGLANPGAEVPWEIRERMFGEARLVPVRLGQRAFKSVIADNYHRRCAITGEKVLPVLEAAHILPVSEGGVHRSDNGLLLRSDMHKLFDVGYIGVDLEYRLQVSPRIRTEFGNGDWLYANAGKPIARPDRDVDLPNREFLKWHQEKVFALRQ